MTVNYIYFKINLKFIIMENYVNQLLDLPKTVGEMLPGNSFNSMVDDSENNIAKWTGIIYKFGALVLVLGAVYGLISPLWDADVSLGEGTDMIGAILGLLIALYAEFPVAQVVRTAGDNLSASSSNIINFVFKDLIVENIKLIGKVMAIGAIFSAICMLLSWLTDITILGGFGYVAMDSVNQFANLPMEGLSALCGMFGLDFVAEVIGDWMNWDVSVSAGEAWSWEGLVAVGWELVSAVLILARMFVSLAVFHFLYGLLTSFAGWLRSPYLPFKSM